MLLSKRQAFNKLHPDWLTCISVGNWTLKLNGFDQNLLCWGFQKQAWDMFYDEDWRILFNNNGTSQSHGKEGLGVDKNMGYLSLVFSYSRRPIGLFQEHLLRPCLQVHWTVDFWTIRAGLLMSVHLGICFEFKTHSHFNLSNQGVWYPKWGVVPWT